MKAQHRCEPNLGWLHRYMSEPLRPAGYVKRASGLSGKEKALAHVKRMVKEKEKADKDRAYLSDAVKSATRTHTKLNNPAKRGWLGRITDAFHKLKGRISGGHGMRG